MKKDSKYIVSYGAGVDSTAMIFLLILDKKPIDYVVFADVGAELPETYETVKLMKEFLDKQAVPFVTVYPAKFRTLQQRCEDRNVIPDRIRRWCTRDVKITPIFKFYRSLDAEINQYIGIDSGEPKRMRPDPENWIHNKYPLIDSGIDRNGCIEIIKNAKFPVPVKSGCYFCIYNNVERLYSIWKYNNELFKQAIIFEESNKHFPRQTLHPKITLREMEKFFLVGKMPVFKN